jgi:hypothetical protein
MSLSRYAFGLAPMIFALALAGCDREQIKVQQVPKDSEQSAQAPMTTQPAAAPGMQANPHSGMDMNGVGAQPQLKWTLPGGWKEKAPSEMRAASFDAGKEGQAADVAVIPLPTDSRPEMELSYYNMWRQSLQLPAADKVQSEPVTIGSAQGKLYDISDPKSSGRILVAALDREGTSWYFKIRGEDAVVKEQKPAFLQFLKSISFAAAPAVAAGNPAPGMTMGQPISAETMATAVSNPSLPAGWKEIPNPPMLLAKYVIQGDGGAKAEVNVSMLNGTGGGAMANVTRWRGQLGLAPLTEEDFSKQAQAVDVAGKKGTQVDMTGTDSTGKKSRLLGIIVPEANDTWFYKLMGDPQIVEQQKEAFTKFIQTAKFSNAN